MLIIIIVSKYNYVCIKNLKIDTQHYMNLLTYCFQTKFWAEWGVGTQIKLLEKTLTFI